MKTIKQTKSNRLKFQTAGKTFKIKKIYLGLLLSLLSTVNYAQNFVEVIGTPFEGDGWNRVAFADIDNDGDQDVIVGSTLYTNDGNGSFEYNFEWDMDYVYSVAFADIDNDDDQDLMISHGKWVNNGYETEFDLHTTSYQNDGTGSFTMLQDFNHSGALGSMGFADVDNDNDLDILISGYWGNDWWWGYNHPLVNLYLNDGSGIFTLASGSNFEGVGYSSVAFADVDNDNDQDVLITGLNGIYPILGEGEATTMLYKNDGFGNFIWSEDTLVGICNGSVAFADIENDSDQDLIFTGLTGTGNNLFPFTGYFTNDGNGNFTHITGLPFDSISSGSIAFADVDNDDDQDLLITGSESGSPIAKLYENDGIGNFTEVTGTPFEGVYSIFTQGTPWEGASSSTIAFADIDNDGDQDVLISGYIENELTVKLYENLLITTSVPEENKAFGGVSIYPNPSQGQVTVDLNELSNVTISVYSLNGRRVYHRENINSPTYQFDLNAGAGIYILEVSTQQETQRYKLVKE